MFNKDTPKKVSAALLKLVPYVIAIASAISAVTPNHTDDELLLTIKQIADILALNVGHNSMPFPDAEAKICSQKEI